MFDLSPVYEDESSGAFKFDNTIDNLLAAPAGVDLISPASVAGEESGAGCQLTIRVEDTDARAPFKVGWWRAHATASSRS